MPAESDETSRALRYTLAMPPRAKTQQETEIKLAVKDLASVVRKLRQLGAKPKGRVLERNTIFDTDSSDLRQRGRMLRLRAETPAPSSFAKGGKRRAVLTSKMRPAGGRDTDGRYKVNIEREVTVYDPLPAPKKAQRTLRDRGWRFALGCLGMRAQFRYDKYRTTFLANGVHIELDETPIGVFLELEGPPDAIDRVAQAIGFAPSDYIRGTYYDLYAAERRRKGRAVRNMLFRR